MIKFYNRYSQSLEVEKVLGEKWIELAYHHPIGKFLTKTLLRRKWVSAFIGDKENTPASRKKIKPFIQNFNIQMEQFKEKDYSHFNDFFIREYKDGLRPFPKENEKCGAFAEGRYFVFNNIDETILFPIKGFHISINELLNGSHSSQNERIDLKPFIGGTLFLGRLCPVDYHRFHFPDSGSTLKTTRISGHYDSVNPIALSAQPDVLFKNERVVTLLETEHFGKMAYIEVGALMVGKIIQSHSQSSFKRGEEKGYFLFGGSTVIVLTEKDKMIPSSDLLENTKSGIETYVRLGDTIGALNPGAKGI